MFPLGISYLSVNFFGTKYYGEAFYPFLTWEDYKSPLIGFSLFMIGHYSFDFFCRKVNSLEFVNDTRKAQ